MGRDREVANIQMNPVHFSKIRRQRRHRNIRVFVEGFEKTEPGGTAYANVYSLLEEGVRMSVMKKKERSWAQHEVFIPLKRLFKKPAQKSMNNNIATRHREKRH
jgi:hypothetical protein